MSKRADAIAIYERLKPKTKQANLKRGWRKTVIYEIMTALKVTEASAAAHFNVARTRDTNAED